MISDSLRARLAQAERDLAAAEEAVSIALDDLDRAEEDRTAAEAALDTLEAECALWDDDPRAAELAAARADPRQLRLALPGHAA